MSEKDPQMSLSIDSPLAVWRDGIGRTYRALGMQESKWKATHISLQGPLHSCLPKGFLRRIMYSFSVLKTSTSLSPRRILRISVMVYVWPFSRPQSVSTSCSSWLGNWEQRKIHKGTRTGRSKAWFFLFFDWFTRVWLELVLLCK